MIKEYTIKRLKVYARADGTLLPNHREGAQQPVDDDWWHDVLHDPRAYLPVTEPSFDHDSHYAHCRLDRHAMKLSPSLVAAAVAGSSAKRS